MRLISTFGFVSLALVGCGQSGNTTADAPVDCALETRADPWGIPMDHHGAAGMLDFQLVSATPAPPARGNNTWLIQVSSMSNDVVGAPMTGAAAGMTATTYMPDHGHYGALQAVITETATAGQYQIDPVNMWMPGYWEDTIAVTSGGVTDQAVFKICVPQ
jgi:hypothetical protein